jgi:glycosyltransferase involved in cell wall biosynthesis
LNQDRGIAPGRKKGAVVHVEAMQEAFRALGCEVLPVEAKDSDAARAQLEALHARAPIDLLYERYALAAAAGGEFARARNVAHVLEVNSPLLEEDALHRGGTFDVAARAKESAVLAAPARVFAVSREVADYVVDQGVPRERVEVHPNAVDTHRFRPLPRAGVRAELGVPEQAFVVGFHGRLRPWHGFERIADAVAGLVERDLPLHVLTVGEGDDAERLAARGLEARATCLAWRPHAEVARVVAAFDVLPLGYGADAPFYYSPLKLLEAMACEVVPVVPDLGELPALVEHGAAGVVYRAGSTAALTEALAGLALDTPMRARLAARAAAIAAGRSWLTTARAALGLVGSHAR